MPSFQIAVLQKDDTQTNANISAESFWLRLSLLPSVNCSLCCTGWRADVNTTPNYKSNSKRAMLCCPAAPSTKAQPSYPNIPHWTAGNMWRSYSRLTIEDRKLFRGCECQRHAGNVLLVFFCLVIFAVRTIYRLVFLLAAKLKFISSPFTTDWRYFSVFLPPDGLFIWQIIYPMQKSLCS